MAPETFTLQWFPGHMAKAMRELEARMRHVHFLIEVADARAPQTSRNPDVKGLARGRPRLLILAKADLADPTTTRFWHERLAQDKERAIAASLLDPADVRRVRRAVHTLRRNAERFSKRKGLVAPELPGVAMPRLGRPAVRGLVVGIPNTGKSTLIRVLGGGRVAVGDRPGVTRGLQELSLGEGMTLLDTPGMLWPRATHGLPALRLAWLGYAGERAYDAVQAAEHLVAWLARHHPTSLVQRYEMSGKEQPNDALKHIARRFGKAKGDEGDPESGARIVLRDFRTGQLGRLSLEHPDDEDSLPDSLDSQEPKG